MNNNLRNLSTLFQAVAAVLEDNRSTLNAADIANGNHGDHMVEIFDLAAQAAQDRAPEDLAGAMEYAARLLAARPDNGSAQVYARGLEQLAQQLRSRGITLNDLAPYVASVLREKNSDAAPAGSAPSRGGDVLKALLAGLSAWQQMESSTADGSPAPAAKMLDMGALFELGMAYMQAKQRGGSRAEVLADAAASASPLAKVPHRYQSGKLAIQTLLEAIARSSTSP